MTTYQSARQIADCIIENCSGKTIVLLSGGSSAKVGIKVLQLLPQEVLDEITVSLTDERFVPFDSDDSNWKLLSSLGLNEIAVQKIAVLGQNSDTREQVSADFLKALTDAHAEAQFVVAIFGIGSDNHIAGILPGTEAAKTNDRIVADYATDKFERITITPPFFSAIDFAFLYAEGAEKASAVQLLQSSLDPINYPAQLLKETNHWEILYNKEAL